MNAPVRFLHLSDTHFASPFLRFSKWDRYIFGKMLRQAHEWRDHFNAVLLTGDLCDSGSRGDIDFGRRVLDGTMRFPDGDGQYWDFPGIGKPLVLLPGNHDRFRQPWLANPGGTNFDHTFAAQWPVGFGGVQPVQIHSTSGNSIWIVAADLTLVAKRHASCRRGHWGQGRAYPNRIDKMVTETCHIKSKTPHAAVIWAVHFPPEFPELVEPLRLVDGHLLIEAAEHCGIEHIFCGHTHRIANYPLVSSVQVHCIGTACCRRWNEHTSFQLVEAADLGTSVRIRRSILVWNQRHSRFENPET